MAMFRTCPRCGHWHEANRPCDPHLALAGLGPAGSGEQGDADRAETEALERFRARRRGTG